MSKSKKAGFKREPKHRGGDLKGSGIFPACCGLMCCGCVFSSRIDARAHRRRQKQKSIEEGLAELADVQADFRYHLTGFDYDDYESEDDYRYDKMIAEEESYFLPWND